MNAYARTGASPRLGIGLASLALVMSACAGAASPQESAVTPTPGIDFTNRTPSPECFNPPPEIRAVILQTDPLACYGGADLTFDAHITGPGAIDCPGELKPGWFHCFQWLALGPPPVGARTTHIVLAATTGTSMPSMFATLHPDTLLNFLDIADRTLRVTGHFDDPAAQSCRYDPWTVVGEPPPPASEAIEGCRHLFVISSVDGIP